MQSKISILVSSCDKNISLLPNFSKLFYKYWERANIYPRYTITATATPECPGFIPILTQDQDWSSSVLKALEHINTPYVYFLLDDFYFFRPFPKTLLERGLQLCEILKLDKYIYHYPHEAFANRLESLIFANNVYKVDQYAEYTLTTQTAIWNVEFFKKCLKVGESPWQFELEGTQRVNSSIKHTIYLELDNRYYVEAMSRGTLTQEGQQLLKREGLI